MAIYGFYSHSSRLYEEVYITKDMSQLEMKKEVTPEKICDRRRITELKQYTCQ
jgi:hypothetical protein